MDNPRYTPTDEEMKSLSSLISERSIPKLNQVTLSYIEKVTDKKLQVTVEMFDEEGKLLIQKGKKKFLMVEI